MIVNVSFKDPAQPALVSLTYARAELAHLKSRRTDARDWARNILGARRDPGMGAIASASVDATADAMLRISLTNFLRYGRQYRRAA
jgi:hypothetical protein